MEERFLLFKAAGEGFAFRLQEISEVMEPQPVFPIPRAPGHFLGLINFHGTLSALVDLPLFLGDDVTDEDAFLALRGRGVTARVEPFARTHARYRVAGTGAVADFLAWLARRGCGGG